MIPMNPPAERRFSERGSQEWRGEGQAGAGRGADARVGAVEHARDEHALAVDDPRRVHNAPLALCQVRLRARARAEVARGEAAPLLHGL